MSNVDDFIPARPQDAHYVIRGFIYQVQRTILAVLKLTEEEHLQLECGEDIDHVLGESPGGKRPSERVLEQIKDRPRPITLRNSQAREAVINAADHLLANWGKTVQLKFRFTTTATPGLERSAPDCMAGVRGIELWESVRRSGNVGEIACLHGLVRTWERPKKVSSERWARCFSRLCADQSLFAELVRRFEWSVRAESFEEMEGIVTKALVDHGLVTAGQPMEAYLRVLAFVISVLAKPGTKRLNRSEIVTLLRRSAAPDEDAFLKWTSKIVVLSHRVSAVEYRQSAVESGQRDLSNRVSELERMTAESIPGQRSNRKSVATSTEQLTTPPLTPRFVIERGEVVRALRNKTTKATWLSLVGGSGTGKTLMARELAMASGRPVRWVRLRNAAPAEVIVNVSAVVDRNSEAVIVLDDLPDLGVHVATAETLAAMFKLGSDQGLRTISTSNYRLPQSLLESQFATCIAEEQVPPMVVGEIVTMLAAYGAPPSECTRIAPLVLAFSDGHPLIVSQLCAFIRDRGWAVDQALLRDVIEGNHLLSIESTVLKTLLATLPEEARNLLYRLRLGGGTFRLETAQRIALVEPPLGLPRERILQLTGPWLQEERPDEYSLSPLVGALREELPARQAQACHAVFARGLLKGTVDQWKAKSAVRHLLLAGKPLSAARVVLQGLMQLGMAKEKVPDAGLTTVWLDSDLPKAIPVPLRIQLRALQVATGLSYGRDVSRAQSDLLALLASVDPADEWAVVMSAMMVFRNLFRDRPEIATLLFKEAAKYGRSARLPNGKLVNEASTLPVDLLLRLVSGDIENVIEANLWLECVEALRSFEDVNWRDIEAGGALICGRVFLREYELPAHEQDWLGVERALLGIAACTRRLNLQYIWASAEGTLLSVRAECLERRDDGLRVAEEALAAIQSGASRFVLRESIARQMVLIGRWDRVRDVLAAAFTDLGDDGLESAVEVAANLMAARAWLNVDPQRAIEHGLRATQLAWDDGYSAVERARVLGDAAITAGRIGDDRLCLRLCDQGLSLLDAGWEESNSRCHVMFLGLSEIVWRLGNKSDSGRSLTTFEPGLFRDLRDLGERVGQDRRSATIRTVVRVASAVGETEVALRWSTRAWELAESADDEALRFLALAVGPGIIGMDFEKVISGLALRTDRLRRSQRWPAPRPSAEELSLLFLWSPVLWRVAEEASREVDVREKLQKLALVARGMTEPDDPIPYWSELAEVLELCAAREPLSLTRAQGQDAGSRATLVGIMALLCSVADTAPLVELVQAHMVALAYDAGVRSDLGLVDAVVLPLVKQFWRRHVRTERFRFTAVRFVEEELDAPIGATSFERAASILAEVAKSLNVGIQFWFAALVPRRGQ